MNEYLPKLIEKFYSYRPHIEQLIKCNHHFQEICNNYKDCIEVLISLKSQAISDLKMFREYHQLSQELEQEIYQFLKKD